MDIKDIFERAFSGVSPLSDSETIFMNVKERAEKMEKNNDFEVKRLIEIEVPEPRAKKSKAPVIAGAAAAVAIIAGGLWFLSSHRSIEFTPLTGSDITVAQSNPAVKDPYMTTNVQPAVTAPGETGVSSLDYLFGKLYDISEAVGTSVATPDGTCLITSAGYSDGLLEISLDSQCSMKRI